MSNPYRTMCAELADLLERSASALETYEISKRASRGVAAAHRARALLAQPELPELTDEVLLRTYGKAKRDHCYEGDADDWLKKSERAYTVAGLRAVIAADRAHRIT